MYKAFTPFRCLSIPDRGQCAFWYIFQIWRQLPQLAEAYYTHLHNAFKSVLRLFCSVG
nr:MAG TPA: hypothetical protein [Bacteriophage sp.]